MDFPDYSASLEAALLWLRTSIPIVLPVGIVLRGRGDSGTGCRSGNVYPVERITSVRSRCYALRLGSVLACGEDLGSRMKLRVRDPECSVAAVGSHISAEDNGWKLYEVRIVFADRDGFVVELLVSSFCGNNGRFPGRLIGRCRGEEVGVPGAWFHKIITMLARSGEAGFIGNSGPSKSGLLVGAGALYAE